MAGIEPASERLERQTSTSVADLRFRQQGVDLQPPKSAILLGPKALFRATRGKLRGTSALFRLSCDRLKFGAGRRGHFWPTVHPIA